MSPTFDENAIRPEALMRGQAECVAADIAWLLARKAEFVDVPCPACDCRDHRPAFSKAGMDYARCQRCATLFLTPRASESLLAAFYEQSLNYGYWNQHIFPASEHARRENIFRPRARRLVDLCRKYRPDARSLLEVGAGFGTFCEEVDELRVFESIVAVEPTPDLARTCRGKGIRVIEQPIEQVELDRPCDVIAAFEVIEHLFSPKAFVEKCARLLSPGGLLILTCPNCRGFEIETLQAASGSVDHEHLNYFHPESLALLMGACGLNVLETLTPGQLDAELVRKAALAGRFDLDSHPFMKRVLIDEWERAGASFQQFLVDSRLSSHLWLVAQRG
jgi:2-polyprenyl-3-methyl-5-hydroxy-6-metoxy-1,4-benzoquinol methylase/ribosomal protein S27E